MNPSPAPAQAAPDIFPFGFEVMGSWETTLPSPSYKTWIRFFAADQHGQQAGRDVFSRLFDAIDLVIFMCSPGARGAATAHGCHFDRAGAYRFWVHEDLTRDDRAQIAEIVRARTADAAGETETAFLVARGK
jgi:hypothetical protein